jgi:hypothetical protein
MSKNDNITIVPGEFKSKFSPKRDHNILLNLDQTQHEFVETDRNVGVDLIEVYDNERQRSTIFRPTFKLKPVINNVYKGKPTYKPFQEQIYYTNAIKIVTNCPGGSQSGAGGTSPGQSTNNVNPIWEGFPDYVELDFIREDYDISGYTKPSSLGPAHVDFVGRSASTYNWSLYLTYPYKNDEDFQLYYYKKGNNNNVVLNQQWKAKEGIPFEIKITVLNGKKIINFQCPVNHNLNIGDYVELSFKYNGINKFQVDYLGDENFGTESYIFGIDDIGYTSTFFNGVKGRFKKILDIKNPEETKSKYYVRIHKVLTDESNVILTKSGFELNVFNTDKQFNNSGLTPSNVSKYSVRNGNQSYVVTFNKDIDISNLFDNQKRPLTSLYLSVVNKGYFGWFNEPSSTKKPNSIKFGFDFNILDVRSPYWSNQFIQSLDNNVFYDSYTKPGGFTFFYNRGLNVGDELYGDFCEWNDYDQTEVVISPIYHKIRYNEGLFITTTIPPLPIVANNTDGYYYKIHHQMKLREFSTYIESAPNQSIYDVPSYSYYSDNDKNFRWRDIYTYGFIDEQNVGVDYPFLNGVHYPFQDVNFKLMPEGYFDYYKKFPTITQPTIDDCETI